MSRVSKRAFTNFVVDAAIAAAFIASAVSGLVFLVPAGWLSVTGSTTSTLGVEYTTWRTIHDWTAIVMIAGVVLHTSLHWGWVKTMVRRLAGGGRAQARPAATRAAAVAAVTTPAPVAAEGSGTDEAVTAVMVPAVTGSSAAGPAVAHGASTRTARVAERRGLTRNTFLKRAGAVGAAALVGGVVGRAAASAAQSWLADDSSTNGTASVVEDSAGGWDSSGPSGSGSSSSGGSASSGSGQSSQSGTTTARVTIDSGRCTGCGECLRVCPFGVFTSNGGQAVVADAEACRLCGHCVQACHAGAIALNG